MYLTWFVEFAIEFSTTGSQTHDLESFTGRSAEVQHHIVKQDIARSANSQKSVSLSSIP